MKSLITKLVTAVKTWLHHEPALTIGGVTGAAVVVQQWITTNHITTVRQGLTLAAPIVLAFVIRQFVSSPAGVEKYAQEVLAGYLAEQSKGQVPPKKLVSPKTVTTIVHTPAPGVPPATTVTTTETITDLSS